MSICMVRKRTHPTFEQLAQVDGWFAGRVRLHFFCARQPLVNTASEMVRRHADAEIAELISPFGIC